MTVAPATAQGNGRLASTATTEALGPTDPAELEAFLDALISRQMEEHHIPGAAVSVVKDGKLFFAKGYGYADLEKKTPIDPEQTIFAIGSVGKIFTWTAVMQLVQGMARLLESTPVPMTMDITLPSRTGASMLSVVDNPYSIDCQQTICMNIETNAVTEYTNYSFQNITVFNGNLIGCNSNGIYLLDTGNTDNGAVINGEFQTGYYDIFSNSMERLREVFINGRKGDMTVSVQADENDEYTYNTNISNQKIHEDRVKVGRGIKGRNFRFRWNNTSREPFDFDNIKIMGEAFSGKRR